MLRFTDLNYFGDVLKASLVIGIAGLLSPVVLSIAWVVLLRIFTKSLVWGTLLILELTSLTGGILCLIKTGVIQVEEIDTTVLTTAIDNAVDTTGYETYIEIVGYILVLFAFLLLTQMIFQRAAIRTAIDVVKLACMALGSMPQLQFFPIITYFSLACLIVYFIIVQCLLMTASDITLDDITLAANTAISSVSSTNSSINVTISATTSTTAVNSVEAINYLYLYHLFGLLWANSFIQGVGIMTIAGAVSQWYWSPFEYVTADTNDDGKIDECDIKVKRTIVKGMPVTSSLIRTIKYHMGSIAFGSLIIAIVQLMRIVMAYITKQAENLGGDSKIKKIVLAIVNCMLWCLEKCVKFISKNSYIYTAIKGTSFCWSAFQSFRLIFNNLARFGMTTLISEVIVLLCKITVILGSTVIGYIWLTYDVTYTSGENMVTRPIIPLACICLFAYMVATSFFNIVDLSIDSILLNYCLDLERKKKGKKLAAEHKFGKIPLKAAEGNDKEEDNGEMDTKCCKCCMCCNGCIQRLCCDRKRKRKLREKKEEKLAQQPEEKEMMLKK